MANQTQPSDVYAAVQESRAGVREEEGRVYASGTEAITVMCVGRQRFDGAGVQWNFPGFPELGVADQKDVGAHEKT